LAVGWIPATVPNLIGDTVAQAGQALNAAGLLFGSVTYGVDYTCTNIGLVTSQSPGGARASAPAPRYRSGSRRPPGRRANARDLAT
jgi:hypothetical protein